MTTLSLSRTAIDGVASCNILFQNDAKWQEVFEGIFAMPARIPMTDAQRSALLEVAWQNWTVC